MADTRAELLAEAIDTAISLGWAFLGWATVLGAALTIFLLTGCALGTWAVRSAWRSIIRPSWAHSRTTARRLARRTRYRKAA